MTTKSNEYKKKRKSAKIISDNESENEFLDILVLKASNTNLDSPEYLQNMIVDFSQGMRRKPRTDTTVLGDSMLKKTFFGRIRRAA